MDLTVIDGRMNSILLNIEFGQATPAQPVIDHVRRGSSAGSAQATPHNDATPGRTRLATAVAGRAAMGHIFGLARCLNGRPTTKNARFITHLRIALKIYLYS